jgi:predicted GIY-YIG superfamily endonuclease
MFVYVLILEQDKWYVGYSERPIGPRFLEHFNHNGAMWTTTYRPLQVMEIRPGGLNEENELTLEMMDKN